MLPRIVIADPALTVGLPAGDHRGRRHGRPVAQSRGLLRARLPPAGARHRRRGRAAGEGPGCRPRCASRANIEARSNMLAAVRGRRDGLPARAWAPCTPWPIRWAPLYGVHHGLLNAVLMPYVITANMPAIDADAAWLARCLGRRRRRRATCSPGSWPCAARSASRTRLAEVGVPASEVAPRSPRMAVEDPSAGDQSRSPSPPPTTPPSATGAGWRTFPGCVKAHPMSDDLASLTPTSS